MREREYSLFSAGIELREKKCQRGEKIRGEGKKRLLFSDSNVRI
ncbi:hypothetical protein PORCRE_1280 [Porphyromonas crevioricanis JCM 15906]|uniref:Uncharacterized protein n=1 Tax=Porphyromonas crevioricanis JCM 15906 TaxID=1305617 RepID=T1DS57_9PORP|nr:hypothetical protein PORCRE_1280 [Porphyromonas crevioricanis JCM 15906]